MIYQRVNRLVARDAWTYYSENKSTGATIRDTAERFKIPSRSLRQNWQAMGLYTPHARKGKKVKQ